MLAASLGILAASIFAAARLSPRFTIVPGSVVVRGVDGELAARVASMADLPGWNWTSLPVDAVAARCASLPEIASASVARRWPNRVDVTVLPRSTWGSLQSRDGRWFRVDRGLVPFGRLEAPLKGFPQVLFRARGAEGVVLGNPVGGADEVDPVVRCWKWSGRHPEFPLASVLLDREGAICLNGLGGVPVHLGSPERLDTKLETLARILEDRPEWADGSVVADINLVSVSAPAVLPRR